MAQQVLRVPEVLAQIGLSRSTLYQRLAEGSFPRPVRLGGRRAIGFLQADVDAWISAQVQASREKGDTR